MKASIIVQNLKCNGGAQTIRTRLSQIKAISDISVNVPERKILFSYNNESEAFDVKEELRRLGYPSIEETNSLGHQMRSLVNCITGKIK